VLEIGTDKMEKQLNEYYKNLSKKVIADNYKHIESFITIENWNYYKHPITNDIYRMPADTNTAHDLITGMPLMARWLCNSECFEEYKKLFIN
jgi:hypothetical protein